MDASCRVLWRREASRRDGPAKGTTQRAEEGCPRQTNHLRLAKRELWMPVELLNAEE